MSAVASPLRRGWQLIQPLFLVLALVFIALLLRSQWGELSGHTWRLHPGWLALSGLLMIGGWCVEVWLWRFALACLGGYLAYPDALRIWFASILVRYIPGNVWQPLGMTVLARQQGVQVEATVGSIALFQAVNLLSVLPIAAFYLLTVGDFGLLEPWLGAATGWLVALAGLGVALFLLRPGWLIGLLNWALTKAGRPRLRAALTTRHLLALLLVALLAWLCWGTSFAALTFGLAAYTAGEMAAALPHLLAAFPIAYAVGYLSFITPSGLAVREGTLYLFLAPVLGGGPTTVAALAIRLWQVILEVVVAGAVGLWTRARNPQRSRLSQLSKSGE
ncbi:MAG: flippase-like domain-containing protein [Caldilineaceae bacterium]|nr:flippase-like domain-containing protein [Caldilineaceae bacterium]